MSNNDKRERQEPEAEVAEGCEGSGNAEATHRCGWNYSAPLQLPKMPKKILQISHKKLKEGLYKYIGFLNTLKALWYPKQNHFKLNKILQAMWI